MHDENLYFDTGAYRVNKTAPHRPYVERLRFEWIAVVALDETLHSLPTRKKTWVIKVHVTLFDVQYYGT